MSNNHKIVRIPDYQDINILVNSKMNIKDAIDKSISQERIDKIGYHNLDILSRMMNYDDEDNKEQKMYEKPFNFDTQDFLDKNNKIVYVTYNNQDFFGKMEDVPTIY
jgi:hypothetical protein